MKLRITYLVLAAIVSFIAGVLSRAEERFDNKVRNDSFAGFNLKTGTLPAQKTGCLGCHSAQ